MNSIADEESDESKESHFKKLKKSEKQPSSTGNQSVTSAMSYNVSQIKQSLK